MTTRDDFTKYHSFKRRLEQDLQSTTDPDRLALTQSLYDRYFPTKERVVSELGPILEEGV